MSGLLPVRVEAWPIVADSKGLWLLSGEDAWRSGPVMADSEPHNMLVALLERHGAPPAVLMHSTSWRPDGDAVILTYVVAIEDPDLIRVKFPQAQPISDRLAGIVGPVPPEAHRPTEPQLPRYIDVLHHALRHLNLLIATDSEMAGAINDLWKHHLKPFEPALSGMYDPELVELPRKAV